MNPYLKTIIDEDSGQEIPNRDYTVWGEGRKAGAGEVVLMGRPLRRGYTSWLKAGEDVRRKWLASDGRGVLVFIPQAFLKELGIEESKDSPCPNST